MYFTSKEKLKCQNFIISNLVLICHIFAIVFLNSLYFDMAIKPSFKVQNIA